MKAVAPAPSPELAPLPLALRGEAIGRTQLPHEVLEQSQRRRVLDAAIGVFAAHGYRATTVEDIVSAAHIGVGSFYALFRGKEDCFLAICDRILATIPERLAAALSPEADWPSQLRAGLAAAIELIAAEPAQARLLLIEAQTAGLLGLERHQALIEQAASFLRRGRALTPFGGELPESLELTLASGVAFVLGERAGAGEGDPALRDDLAAFLLEPYLGEVTRLPAPASGAAA